MLPLMLTSEKQPLSSTQVYCAEDDTTRVATRNEHAGRPAASAPVGPQGRKQQQIGLVFHQQDAASRQPPDSAADTAFFSHAPDLAPVHTAAASRRNRGGSMRGESCRRKVSYRCTLATRPAAIARSSSSQSIRVPQASVSESSATTPSNHRSTQEAVLRVPGQVAIRHPKHHGSVRSSGKCSAGSCATCGKSLSPNVRDRIPKRQASADTTEHPVNSSVAFPTGNAGGTTTIKSSLKQPRRSPDAIRSESRV